MPQEQEIGAFEMLVIGAGMGGISAAIWGHRLGMRVGLLEKGRLGGQLHLIHKEIPDYPGLVCSNGAEMALRMEQHLAQLAGLERIEGEVLEIMPEEGLLRFRSTDGAVGTLRAGALVLATGLARRRLAMPDLRAWEGRGVAYTASGEREMFVGKRVCIVGGGDGALENALWLVETCGCPEVIVAYRGDSFRARGDFLQEAEQHPQIRLLRRCVVEHCEGEERLEAIWLRNDGQLERHEMGALLIKIGFSPQSQLVAESCETDAQGYIVVDAVQKTTASRLWAVGDVCTPIDPSISVCVGQGCLAAREIQRFLRGDVG
ncbi:MAG: FAD-dependent oxidoreductase [Myxococcales bacterium]|nr:FAD-dependent oxidoreductase [Myxococcales bacterium]